MLIPGCRKYVPVRGVSQPRIHMITVNRFQELGDFGLVTYSRRLRFLSCHAERSNWLVNLKEILTAFDIPTWVGLILSLTCCSMATVKFYYVSRKIHTTTETGNQSFKNADVAYQIFTSLLEQGCGLYQNRQLRQSGGVGLTIFFLSVMLSVLSNEYKGDNIGRLTIIPPLIPFNQYKDLVSNNFSIYVMPLNITHLSVQLAFPREKNQSIWYRQVNGHEAIPVVSEYWYRLNKKNTYWKRLKGLVKEATSTVKLYAETSQLFPTWNISKPRYDGRYDIDPFITSHLNLCYKQAAILDEWDTQRVYKTFVEAGKPIFYGKDKIHETVAGYILRGHFGFRFHKRAKYLTETGIFEWWNGIHAYLASREKFNVSLSEPSGHVSSKQKSSTHVLVLITLFGVCLIMNISALLYEIHKNTSTLIGKQRIKVCKVVLQLMVFKTRNRIKMKIKGLKILKYCLQFKELY